MKKFFSDMNTSRFWAFVMWLLGSIVIFSGVAAMLTAANTFHNIIGVVLGLSWLYISFESRMFTK